MRILTCSAAVLLALATLAPPARADDDVKKVIDKAVKAHGGLDALKKNKDKAVVLKGKMHIESVNIDATTEVSFTGGANKKFRQDLEFTFMGQNIKQAVGYDGKTGWIALNGKVMKTFDSKEEVEALQETLYSEEVAELVMVGDKSLELSIIGEDKVGDTPVIGIRVVKKGHKDVSLFFDKESGLLKKVVNRGLDLQTGTEVEQERFFSDYKEVDGEKRAMKIVMNQDGKKFVELEITEVKYADKLDDDLFVKPKE